ncbi:MAG: hypothetical protein ACPLPT_03585 [Moorellales bacterium]
MEPKGRHPDRNRQERLVREAAALMDVFRLIGSTFYFITALIPFVLGAVPFMPPGPASQADIDE